MGLASFTGLLFFSFWIYCDDTPPFKTRPADVSLPGPSTESDRPAQASNDRARRNDNSTWPGPAPVRALLMYGSLMACFSVMALQMIWRFGFLFGLNKLLPEYRADAIMEICLVALFSGKILVDSVNIQDDIPWWRIWRASGPMMFAMMLQMGIAIGNLIVIRFSETCLGRLGQAIVVYTVMTSLLITTFLESPHKPELPDQPTESVSATPVSTNNQRRPSFPGIDWRYSFRTFRVSPPNATTPSPPALPQALGNRPPLQRRNTTASRVSQWIQSKVPGPKDDGGDDRLRLWDAGRLEKGEKDQEKTLTTEEDFSPMARSAPQKEAPSPYSTSLPYTMPPPPSRDAAPVTGAKLANWALPDFAQVNVSQNDVGQPSPSRESSIAERERRNTIASSRSATSQWTSPNRAVGDRIDSPVYGLEGIVRSLRKEDAKQQQAFFQLTGLGSPPRELFSPVVPAPGPSKPVATKPAATKRYSRRRSSSIPPPQKPPPTALAPQPVLPRVVLPPFQSNRQSSRPEEMSDGSKSLATTPGQESILTSDISLSQFPSPPSVGFQSAYYDDEDDTSIEEGSPTVTGHTSRPTTSRGPPPKGGLPPTPAKRKMTNDSLFVDDIPFTLVPPKMPAAMAETGRARQESFPSTTRGSDLSNIFSGQTSNPVGQNAPEGTRINVTSFIGAAAHVRQDSDRSLGMSSIIPEEEERRSAYSTDGEPAVVTTVRRGNSWGRPRLVDQASLASSPSGTSIPGRTSPTSRLANALPTNPRPAAAPAGRGIPVAVGGSSSGRPIATQPLRVRKQNIQISGPFPPEEIPMDFDRPRPPPPALR